MSVAEELAEKHIPAHNAIDEERGEGHYHCEECADAIRARAVAAVNEAIERAAQVCETITPDESYPNKHDVAREIRALKAHIER